jgi:hypothetical protein
MLHSSGKAGHLYALLSPPLSTSPENVTILLVRIRSFFSLFGGLARAFHGFKHSFQTSRGQPPRRRASCISTDRWSLFWVPMLADLRVSLAFEATQIATDGT